VFTESSDEEGDDDDESEEQEESSEEGGDDDSDFEMEEEEGAAGGKRKGKKAGPAAKKAAPTKAGRQVKSSAKANKVMLTALLSVSMGELPEYRCSSQHITACIQPLYLLVSGLCPA
jgi:hypothetical protein